METRISTTLTRWLAALAALFLIGGCDVTSEDQAPAEVVLEITVDDGAITWSQQGMERLVEGQDDVPARITLRQADGTVIADVRGASFREARELAMVEARKRGAEVLERFESMPAAEQDATLEAMLARIEVLKGPTRRDGRG